MPFFLKPSVLIRQTKPYNPNTNWRRRLLEKRNATRRDNRIRHVLNARDPHSHRVAEEIVQLLRCFLVRSEFAVMAANLKPRKLKRHPCQLPVCRVPGVSAAFWIRLVVANSKPSECRAVQQNRVRAPDGKHHGMIGSELVQRYPRCLRIVQPGIAEDALNPGAFRSFRYSGRDSLFDFLPTWVSAFDRQIVSIRPDTKVNMGI